MTTITEPEPRTKPKGNPEREVQQMPQKKKVQENPDKRQKYESVFVRNVFLTFPTRWPSRTRAAVLPAGLRRASAGDILINPETQPQHEPYRKERGKGGHGEEK